MKKFVFRLATLLKVKLSQEKEQKARLMEIRELLRKLRAQLEELFERQAETSRMYQEESAGGITGNRLSVYGLYFDHLRDAIEEQNKRIDEAEAEKEKRQDALLRTMKEIKALNKLREKQYAEYLEEVARDEEKTIGDIVSFKVTAGESLTI